MKLKNSVQIVLSLITLTTISACSDDDYYYNQNHYATASNYELRIGTQVCKKADYAYCGQAGAKSNPDGSLYFRRTNGSMIAAQSSVIEVEGFVRFTLDNGQVEERTINTFFQTDSSADFSFDYKLTLDKPARISSINYVDLKLSSVVGNTTYSKTIRYNDENLWSATSGVSYLLYQYNLSLFNSASNYGTLSRIWDIGADVVLEQE